MKDEIKIMKMLEGKIIKIFIASILIAISCFLTFYFHAILETEVVFSHFFYIPIILAALWWKRKGLVIAVFLAALLILSHSFIGMNAETVNDLIRASIFIAIAFVVATLSERIVKAQKKTAHLNAILSAIRNVNQLIVREKDRDPMVQGACEHLIESRGYYSAWIALVDENQGFLTAAEAGLEGSFSPIVEMMKRGKFTRCGQKALEQSGVMVIEDIATACADCPLVSTYSGRAGMIVRLEHDTRVYGILSVSIPAEMTMDADEQSLFDEVAGDIAFALHDMELDKRRKRAENELQSLNEELEWRVEERTKDLVKERDYIRHLIESSPDFHVVIDKDGKILDSTKAVEELLGKSHEGIIGISIYEYLPKEEAEKAIVEMFERGQVRNVELTASIPEKGDMIFDLSGTVFNTSEGERGVYLSGRDVTERKKAEEKLKKSNEKFQEIFNGVSDAIFIHDLKDLSIIDVNGTVCRRFGYTREEIKNMSVDDLSEGELFSVDDTANQDLFKKIMNGEVVTKEWLSKNKDGDTFWQDMTIKLVEIEGEKRLLAIARNIDERKKAEERLSKYHRKIEQQNIELKKLDKLKSNFLNVTSHELRTPMSAIKGYVQMVLKQALGEISEEQKKALNVVLRNTDRLDNLIRDILDVSRLESGTMKFVPGQTDLEKMVDEAVETLQSSADLKNIKINMDLEDNLPELIIDQERIKQVIINIVNNAIKFSPDGSIVNIRAEKEKEDVLFEFQDFGKGIPKNKQKKVFDMFYQVDSDMDRKFGGTGLGLAISQGIVFSHGGKIWVESKAGEGSTFRFILPIKPVQDIEDRFREADIFGLESNKEDTKDN